MPPRLAHQQVNVVGHDDVAEDVKLVACTENFERLLERGAAKDVIQKSEAVTAGEGEEVIVA